MKKLLLSLFCYVFLIFSSFGQNISILTQHGDNFRTGWNPREKTLTTSNINKSSFGKIYTMPVDDQIYAQPLVVSNLNIGGANHNVVFVATVNNTVYAFDADKAGGFWSKNYTNAGQRPPTHKDMTGACGGNYNDFSGNIGIVGTPVIDSAKNTMYFVSRSTDSPTGSNGTGNFYQYLHAIDITTGIDRPNSPVLITARVNGSGDGNQNGVVNFDPLKQNQRTGLLLLNGVVMITWAGHCDWPPYHGWVLGYDENTLQQKIVYNTTPDGYAGGIWMSGGGPAADGIGNMYVSVGNGSIGLNGDLSKVRNRSESAVKFTPTGNTLAISSFFTPMNYQSLENADLDFGVTQLMLLPNTNLAVTGCKDGSIYVMNRDNMGGYNASGNNVLQTINIGSGKTLRSSLAYYQGSSKAFLYTWSENAALKAFPYIPGSGIFDVNNVIIGNAQGPNGSNGTLLSVSSNGSKDGSGILWASHAASGDANQSVRPGILRAFDANDVTKELWNSNMNPADNIGNYAKFVCPTIANGKVFMASFSNQLVVYGITDTTSTASCNATGNVALGKPVFASSVQSPLYLPSYSNDGDTTTRWSSLASDPQWIYIDLGARYNLCNVVLKWEAAYGKDFQIQVSDDTTHWTTLSTITGNTSLKNTIYVKGAGRYVRMYGTARGTNYGYSLFDFQVNGSAANACPTPDSLSASGIARTGSKLNWNAVPGVTGYTVQYKTVGATTFTSSLVNTNSLQLNNLSCGTDYLFNVQSICSPTSSSTVSGNKGFSTLVCDASCGFLPTRWFNRDIGSVTIPGTTCFNNGIFRLQASGTDIWGNADGLQMAYKTFTGDGTVTARIDSLNGANPWAKAGIMFRETMDSTSRQALMALTPSAVNGAAFQYRQTAGGISTNTNLPGIQPPYFVKVIKRGTTYAGYISPDSLVWKQVGSTVDLGFGSGPVSAGIVLTGHDNTQLAKAVFSHVPIIFSSDTTANPVVTNCPSSNIALNRPGASSSTPDFQQINYAFNSFDGNLSTAWTSAQSTNPQWLSVDLGLSYQVCQVSITWGTAYAQSFQIQVSDDATNWKTIQSITGNTSLNNVIALNATGRFIRVYATVPALGSGYSIAELQVSGTALQNQLPNIALNKNGYSSTVENSNLLPFNSFDGLGNTRWASAAGIDSSWIYVDLGANYAINQVVLDWEQALAQNFQIQLSTDAVNWNTVGSVSGNNLFTNVLSVSGTGRYVRMLATKRGTLFGYSLYEFEVYGSPSTSTTVPTVLEAENANLSGVQGSNIWTGFSGGGFGDYINPYSDFIEWTYIAPVTGNYKLGFKYALGAPVGRPLQLNVNGVIIQPALPFPITTSWTDWQTVTTTVNLKAGTNLIRTTAIGSSGANVDHLEVSPAPAQAATFATRTLSAQPSLNAYPVPANNILSIESADLITGDLGIVNVSSSRSFIPVYISRTSTKIVLNVSALNPGIYSINLTTSKGRVSTMISIQRQ